MLRPAVIAIFTVVLTVFLLHLEQIPITTHHIRRQQSSSRTPAA
jgi:hypothetical protein